MSTTRRVTVVQTGVSVRVQVALAVIQAHLGDLAAAAGPEVARQIHRYVEQERLGYYPALEFFHARVDIAAGLVAAVEQVGEFVCEHARSTARSRLWPVFSQVRVMHAQLLALTLPSVRPQHPDALTALIAHYTPNAVKLTLHLSSIEKRTTLDGAEKFAANKVVQWLREAFETVEITDARLL